MVWMCECIECGSHRFGGDPCAGMAELDSAVAAGECSFCKVDYDLKFD